MNLHLPRFHDKYVPISSSIIRPLARDNLQARFYKRQQIVSRGQTENCSRYHCNGIFHAQGCFFTHGGMFRFEILTQVSPYDLLIAYVVTVTFVILFSKISSCKHHLATVALTHFVSEVACATILPRKERTAIRGAGFPWYVDRVCSERSSSEPIIRMGDYFEEISEIGR